MNKSIFKTIAVGVLIGAIAFAMPFFLLRTVIFFFLIGGLFRRFIGRRFGKRFGGGRLQPAFADKIRSMGEEGYVQFKTTFQNHCGKKQYNKETATATK